MLNGHVVVVTGAAGTIGAPVCSAIAASGGVPVVADIDADAAKATVEGLHRAGFEADWAQVDITDSAALDSLIFDVNASRGRVDAVVNSAYPRGASYGRAVEDVTYADFCDTVDVHLGGYFLVAQRFGRYFRGRGTGSIVNLASIYGVFPPDFTMYEGTTMTMPVEYAATKAGVVSLTRYFAQYYLPYGVRCNAVAPGGVREDQPASFQTAYDARSGQRGLLEPEDIAGTVVFLVSDAARHVTGQVIVVDDGWSL